MTSRERILTTLSHREPDRVPYDLGGFGPTGISLGAYEKFLKHRNIPEKAEGSVASGQRAKLGETMLERLSVDTRPLVYGAQGSWTLELQEEGDSRYYFDEWGIGFKKSDTGGHNYFIFHHPLAQVETDDLPGYSWPDPLDAHRLDGLKEIAENFRKTSDPAIILSGTFSQGILQFAAQLEGYERFFTNMVMEPARVEWLMNKILELKLTFYERTLTVLDGYVDILCEADDFGHQRGQWISLDMFRKYVKPRYMELYSFLKKRFKVKIFQHSCGAIYPFIPEIIDMGADILNPIQLSAKDMGDTKKLKREFRDDIAFWGGGVDVQQDLPFLSPHQVEDEVKRRIEDLAPGGGFVFAATQTIQPDTPPENIEAMLRTLQKYGVYSKNHESTKV